GDADIVEIARPLIVVDEYTEVPRVGVEGTIVDYESRVDQVVVECAVVDDPAVVADVAGHMDHGALTVEDRAAEPVDDVAAHIDLTAGAIDDRAAAPVHEVVADVQLTTVDDPAARLVLEVVVRGDHAAGLIDDQATLLVLDVIRGNVAAGLIDDLSALGVRDVGNHVLAELETQRWAPAGMIDVIVRNGVVELWGTVLDARLRDAARVAAETVPGVKAV